MTADLVPAYEEYTEPELNSNWGSERCLESAQNGEKPFPTLIPQGLCHSGHSQVHFPGCRSIRNPSCVLPSLSARGEHLQGLAGSELLTLLKSLPAKLFPVPVTSWSYKQVHVIPNDAMWIKYKNY